MVNSRQPIYHMCRLTEWRAAEAGGSYPGSSQDAADGFIHFSTAAQVAASAAKHRAGQTGLVLLSVDPAPLGEALKWEQARGGDLFPHLHGPLPVTCGPAAGTGWHAGTPATKLMWRACWATRGRT